jgi:hypothetical protein
MSLYLKCCQLFNVSGIDMNGASCPSMTKDLTSQFLSGFPTVPMATGVIASIDRRCHHLGILFQNKQSMSWNVNEDHGVTLTPSSRPSFPKGFRFAHYPYYPQQLYPVPSIMTPSTVSLLLTILCLNRGGESSCKGHEEELPLCKMGFPGVS